MPVVATRSVYVGGHLMDDIRRRAEYYKSRAYRQGRAHYLCGKRAAQKHLLLGVPVVVLSAVVGSTAFLAIGSNPAAEWKVVTGFLSLSAAVLASLQTFFKFSELAEKHRTSAAAYSSLKRRFDTLQLRILDTDKNREENLAALEVILQDLEHLETESLDVPDIVYDRAVEEGRNNQEST